MNNLKYKITIFVCLGLLAAACNSSSPPKKTDSTPSENVQAVDPCQTGTGSPQAGRQANNGGQPTQNQAAGSSGFPLAGAVAYQTQVKPLLQSYCSSCHGTGSQLPLTSYQEISPYKFNVVSIASGSALDANHQNLNISQDAVQVFTAWQSNNFSEGSNAPPQSNNPGQQGSYNPCPETGPVQAGEVDGMLDVLNSPEKLLCDQKGQVFDRDQKQCLSATLDKAMCSSLQSVVAAFTNAGASQQEISNQLNTYTLKGYEFEQCGHKSDGSPVVTLLLKLPAEEKILSALIQL